jgi:hypothetical protein
LQFIGHAIEGNRPEVFRDWRFVLIGLELVVDDGAGKNCIKPTTEQPGAFLDWRAGERWEKGTAFQRCPSGSLEACGPFP